MKLTPSPAIALFALGCIGDGDTKDTTTDDGTPPMAYTTPPMTTAPMPPPMPYTTPTGDTGATGTMMGTPGISPPPLAEPDESKAG